MHQLDEDLQVVSNKLEDLVRQNMLDADTSDREYDVQFGLLSRVYKSSHTDAAEQSINLVLDPEARRTGTETSAMALNREY